MPRVYTVRDKDGNEIITDSLRNISKELKMSKETIYRRSYFSGTIPIYGYRVELRDDLWCCSMCGKIVQKNQYNLYKTHTTDNFDTMCMDCRRKYVIERQRNSRRKSNDSNE